MELFTIGFTKKSANKFFELLKNNRVEALIDVRLNNVSQLAGFAKGEDLKYFLSEICNCKYFHEVTFAPTKELLSSYRSGKTSWQEYVKVFTQIMEERNVYSVFKSKYSSCSKICLLCSEDTPEQCHRRLLAEEFKRNDESIEIIHL